MTYVEGSNGSPGIEVLVARSGNKKSREMQLKLGQKNLRRLARGNTQAIDEINKQIMAHCNVRGWRGMTDEDGKEIPHTPELALEIFNDPRYADFYEFCQQESGFDDEFRAETMEEAAGNS